MEDKKESLGIVGQVMIREENFLRESWIGDNTSNAWLHKDPRLQNEPSLAEIMLKIQNLEYKLSDLKTMIINKMDIPKEKIKRRKLIP